MRVLFCISGIGTGHVSRCRPVVDSLTARGHSCFAAVTGYRAGKLLEDVCPVMTPPPDYRKRVAPSTGAMPPYLVIPDLESVVSAYQRDAADGLAATLDFFEDAIDETRPELIVVDQVMGPAALARERGIGVVQVSHPPFLPGYGPWMKWAGKTDPRIVSPPAQVILDEAFAAREAATPSVEDLFSGDLVLIPGHPAFGTCEKAFHFRPNRLPERLPAEGRQAEPPLVLSYMSFMAQELGVDVVRGILDAGCRAALIDGNNYGLPEEIAGDPRVSILGREPIEELLVQASAIIHGGGSGIAQEALAAGTPQVSVPRNTEQETTGRKLEQFGAGKLVAVSDQPLETIELSSGFRTLAHPSASHLARRITIALSDLLADDRAVEASLQKGNEIRLLPTVDDATIEIENLMAARA